MKKNCLIRSLFAGLAYLSLAPVIHSAPVPPTDNTTQPYMGIYGGTLGASGRNSGIAHGTYTASWLNRSGLWAEEFLAYDSWANLEGPGWALNPCATWLARNPTGKLLLTVGMLPGVGRTPLAGTSLAIGATGAYNSHYQKLAQNLVNRGLANNTIIRLGHEFTGFWYPWCPVTTAKAESYAAYWRQIVTTMRAVPGAENLKFDWNGATTWTEYSLATAYPGDAYVDYIGVDVYDACYAPNTYPYPANATPAQILACQQLAWNTLSSSANKTNGLGLFRNFASARGKPMSIPEWGVCDGGDGHGGGDNTYYIQKMYDFIQDPANNVAYHLYFDYSAQDSNHLITELPGGSATHFPNAAALVQKLFGIPQFPMSNDIGVVGVPGGRDFTTVYGAGTGYSNGTSDSFHFASRATGGEDALIVEIASMSGSATAQSGIMLRESTTAGAPYASLFLSNGSCIFQSRTTSGGTATRNYTASSGALPIWLKLVRSGNGVSGYLSEDGLNWTFAGKQTIPMAPGAYFGIAVSSGSTQETNLTTFRNVDAADIAMSETDSVPAAIILDNAATTGVTKAGAWSESSATEGFYGTNYLHDNNTSKGSCSVTFAPTVASSGLHDVYACWPMGNNRAGNTPITVTATTGVYQGTVDQVIGSSLWNYIGTFDFAAGSAGKVTIGNTGTSGYVMADAIMLVPLPAPTLPSPKVAVDIGTPALVGSAGYSGGIYSIIAGGTGMGGTSDQFNYVYQALTGNQTLICRTTGITNSSANAKTGLMFRKDLSANAAFVMLSVSYNGHVKLDYRTSAGVAAVAIYPSKTSIIPSPTTPIWLKLVKNGSTYYGYYATTLGTPAAGDWRLHGYVYLTFASTYAGLATASCNAAATTTATVDNVTP